MPERDFLSIAKYIEELAIRDYYPITESATQTYLGRRISPKTAIRGTIPFRRPGGKIHFPHRLRETMYQICRILPRLLRGNCVSQLKDTW